MNDWLDLVLGWVLDHPWWSVGLGSGALLVTGALVLR